MGKVVVSEFVSLDGVIEDPGGAEGTDFGGWTFRFPAPEGQQFKLAELRAADVRCSAASPTKGSPPPGRR